MRKGQQVAAYVDAGDGFIWLLVKIEKKQGSGKYIVHDEFPDEPELERFVVESSKISPFPNTEGPYHVGDHVLARWENEDDDWTTELYDAEVKKVNRNGTLSLQYINSDEIIETSLKMITKYSEGFFEEEEANEGTQKEAEVVKEEKAAPARGKGRGKKGKKAETKKKQTKKNAKVQEEVEEPEEVAESAKTVINIAKDEDRSAQEEVAKSSSSDEPEQSTGVETPIPSSPRASPPPVDESSSQEVATPERRQIVPKPEPEKRDVTFIFNKPVYDGKVDIKLLDDNQIAQIIPPPVELKRMHITEGTPLLDCLEDPDLFNQSEHHTTSSGIIYRSGFESDNRRGYSSGLLKGEPCGRLGKVFKNLN